MILPAAGNRLKLLLVEDDLDVAAGIGDYLSARGIEVDFACSAAQARARIAAEAFDLLVLDVNLPGQNGITLCRALKQAGGLRSPILFLTARAGLEDKLQAFEAGAVDYMVKPFAPAELLARVLAISAHARATGGAVVRAGEYALDLQGRLLSRGERCLPLHGAGFALLRALMEACPAAVAREALHRQLWEGESPGSDPLRMHVYQLRQQLQACFGEPLIETRRGMGYRFAGGDDETA